ncbi:MAG: hypothetical protein K2J77_01160 [Oscillospiraceae bacterium]|nr:hypothetical protein [Oscillospiraceae bacterium]
MKKRLTFFLAIMLAVMLSGCAKSEPVTPPAEPVRSVIIADNESSPESTQGSSESTGEGVPEYPVQNTASYIVTVTNYEDGELFSTNINTYDEHGNMIKNTSKYGDIYYAYDYNDDGTVRVEYSETSRKEYEYENGLEVKCTQYNAFGEVYSVSTYTYDEHGNATSFYHGVGEFVSGCTYEHEYDENGFWIKEIGYDEDGEISGVATRVLGENGEVLSGTLEEKNALRTYEHKYDENGREVERHSTQTRGGEVVWERRVLTEYDEQGRVSRKEEYHLDGGERLVSTEEYEYLKP